MPKTVLKYLVVAALSVSAAVASAIELAPHRAIYRMTLSKAAATSGVAGAEGAMLYKFGETCDAWTSETSVVLKLLYVEGEETETSWSFVSSEAKDGLTYRFRVRQIQNGTTTENLQGEVTRASVNGATKATFSSPAGTIIEIPQGTMFPTRHLLALIDAGKKGDLTFSRTVFDGASLDNPYNINALITPGSGGKAPSETPFRHVRMAFFPLLSRKESPEFELGIDYRENGIADRILQDFGDFTLNLIPQKIEVLDHPKC